MSKSDYDCCRTGHDFIRKAKKHPNLKRQRQAGSHWTGDTELGRITIADHTKELPPFLRKKIRLDLIAIGLGLFVLAPVVALQLLKGI